MTSRTRFGSRATLMPSTSTSPEKFFSNVEIILTIVVLPAPLGPNSPSTLPFSTARSRPSKAFTAPNDLCTADA